MNSIYHIMVLWANALCEKDFILRDLESQFTIYKIFHVHWDKDLFLDNYTVFYAHSQKHLSYHQYRNLLKGKISHCGDGDFIAIIFRDDSPIFETRKTSSGERQVNVRVFDKKTQYRELTGGGHKVHSSDDAWETNKDLTLMFGLNTEDFIQHYSLSTEIESYDKNCLGVGGYSSIHQLFYVLNNTVKYVVLRNYECLPDEYTVEGHGDIDLLVEDKNYIAYLTLANPVFPESYRVYHILNIAGKDIPFDFRHVGDNYYDRPWEENILKNRTFIKSLFYVPCLEDQFYSLLYHAYIQKHEVKQDYIPKLNEFGKTLGIDYSNNPNLTISLLDDYLQKHAYEYIRPQDKSVVYNEQNLQLSGYALRFGHFIKRVEETGNNGYVYQSLVYEKTDGFIKIGTPWIIDNESSFLKKLSKYEYFPHLISERNEGKQKLIEISRVVGVNFTDFFRDIKHQRKSYLLSFLDESMKILAVLNGHNICHRDFLPSNIMIADVDGRCQVGLIDFGWAIENDQEEVTHPLHLGGYYRAKDRDSDLYTLSSMLLEQWYDLPYIVRIAKVLRGNDVGTAGQRQMLQEAKKKMSAPFTPYEELRLFLRRHQRPRMLLDAFKRKVKKVISR
ncbi:MAG: hypothetical protein Q4D25_00420 [Bacteroidales bacterium]|nr:hypothetical protein [Bacteroidales bacterium]